LEQGVLVAEGRIDAPRGPWRQARRIEMVWRWG
jgi:hypothetical protein